MRASNRRDQGNHITIIRRQIKKNHGGHHGGAWKVAFADFTLAMMALFMVLWIVNSVSQEERKDIVAVLLGQSVFTGGLTPLNKLNVKVATKGKGNHDSRLSGVNNQVNDAYEAKKITVITPENETTEKAKEITALLKQQSIRELSDLATNINLIAEKTHMETNLEMEIVPQGLRILVKDDKNRIMFERGSANIKPFFRALLTDLTPVFDSLDNKIIITGHTDSMQYKQNTYNNWNLSGDRAQSARRVMELAGMPSDKVMQVSAMSDQMLLNAQNPQGADNRRIEIMILTHIASDTLYQFFGAQGEKVVKPIARQLDEGKKPLIKLSDFSIEKKNS